MANNGSKTAAFVCVTTLFFAWGFVTSVIDPLIPAVKSVFTLSYAESMLTQFAWFIAYGLVSLPAAALLARLGFVSSIVVALGAMVAGCLLVPLATMLDAYAGVLLALFVIASGVTLLQVAANPLVAALGAPQRAHFRLTFAQAFNSLGTVIGPYLGATIMLSGGLFGADVALDAHASRAETLRSIDSQFIFVAIFFAALGLFIWLVRGRINDAAPPATKGPAAPWQAFRSGWALFGGLAIFLYVGAEVAIASIMINFLVHIDFHVFLANVGFIDVLARAGMIDPANPPEEIAGKTLGLCYWGGAMIGRFVGSWLLTRVNAGALLAVAASIAVALCVAVSQSQGQIGGVAALAVGFFNSIMFPTIFTLTLARSVAPAPAVSGLLCMSIVGGALIPPLMGMAADTLGLELAFFVPAVSYLGIVAFAWAAARARPATSEPALAPIGGH